MPFFFNVLPYRNRAKLKQGYSSLQVMQPQYEPCKKTTLIRENSVKGLKARVQVDYTSRECSIDKQSLPKISQKKSTLQQKHAQFPKYITYDVQYKLTKMFM